MLDHPGTSISGAFTRDGLVAMATLHLLPNVTWNARPYGLVENVVTRADHRKRGFGRAVLEQLLATAWAANAYKVMLMTGQKRGALGFYQSVGFTQEDKHGLVIRCP
ncbi:MAG: GNAT family N-acetyltransferase [Roseobacter sp.]